MADQVLCDGCLGSRRCWVCLGQGVIDTRPGRIDACGRCFGSGKCTQCQPVSIVDLGAPYELEDAGDEGAADGTVA